MSYAFRGTVVINGHCEFPCTEFEGSPRRVVGIIGEHCEKCITELLRLAPRCAFRVRDLRRGVVEG